MKKVYLLGSVAALVAAGSFSLHASAAGFSEVGEYGRPFVYVTEDTKEQIEEEIYLGELELLAQLVEAEAGNQPFEGKCLVADTVLNRVESDIFPDSITDVIYQKGQFSTTWNGALEKAAWTVSDEDFRAVMYEVELHGNKDVLYFNNNKNVSGKGQIYKVGGHYFRNG